ncbi:MerR family transcriptional regulator [Candidatus Peregrinibacteria bacterium]|nr:MerR family transcriptional regulator [Candidatus Peregrinibacteria bacterium]
MDDRLLKITEAAKRLGVTPQTLRNWEKTGQLNALRYHATGNRMYRESDLLMLLNQFSNNIEPALKWAEVTDAGEPPEAFYCKFRDQFSANLWKKDMEWKKVFGEEKGALVTAIVGEIGNNSFDHNLGKWPDITGIWFEWFEISKQIVLADRGVGILTSLRQVRPSLKNDQEALKAAFNEILTGRAPEQRGNGLKFVKSLSLSHGLGLSFQSGNAHLEIKNGTLSGPEKTENEVPGCLAILNLHTL